MQALAISRLGYANSLLTGLPACTLRKLELVQNSAAKLLTGTSRRARIMPVLRELHWLPVARGITYKVLCLVHKALHEMSAPAYLRSLLREFGNERELRSVLRPLWWHLVPSKVMLTERSGFTHLRCGIPCHCISEILQAWPLLKELWIVDSF